MRKCTVSLWLYEALEWTNEVKREAEQTMERKRTDEIENENEDLGLRAFRVATTICHHFARIGVYAHFNLLYLHLFQQRNKIKYSQCYNCIVFFTWVFLSLSLVVDLQQAFWCVFVIGAIEMAYIDHECVCPCGWSVHAIFEMLISSVDSVVINMVSLWPYTQSSDWQKPHNQTKIKCTTCTLYILVVAMWHSVVTPLHLIFLLVSTRPFSHFSP